MQCEGSNQVKKGNTYSCKIVSSDTNKYVNVFSVKMNGGELEKNVDYSFSNDTLSVSKAVIGDIVISAFTKEYDKTYYNVIYNAKDCFFNGNNKVAVNGTYSCTIIPKDQENYFSEVYSIKMNSVELLSSNYSFINNAFCYDTAIPGLTFGSEISTNLKMGLNIFIGWTSNQTLTFSSHLMKDFDRQRASLVSYWGWTFSNKQSLFSVWSNEYSCSSTESSDLKCVISEN